MCSQARDPHVGEVVHILEDLEIDPSGFFLTLRETLERWRDASLMWQTGTSLTAGETAVLERGGFSATPVSRHIGNAGDLTYLALLSTAIPVNAAAVRLAATAGRIRQRLAEGTLFGIKQGGEWRLPIFQFNDQTGEVPGIATVLRAMDLEELHPLSVASWFLNPHPDLQSPSGQALSPLTWLQTGGPPGRVADLARTLSVTV